ncbi:hypothetical protein TKK_0011012 [Trichogramma kaykai]
MSDWEEETFSVGPTISAGYGHGHLKNDFNDDSGTFCNSTKDYYDDEHSQNQGGGGGGFRGSRGGGGSGRGGGFGRGRRNDDESGFDNSNGYGGGKRNDDNPFSSGGGGRSYGGGDNGERSGGGFRGGRGGRGGGGGGRSFNRNNEQSDNPYGSSKGFDDNQNDNPFGSSNKGGFGDDNNDDPWGSKGGFGDDGNDNSYGGRGGRGGGRGRGRGGRGGGGDRGDREDRGFGGNKGDREDREGGDEKPREVYCPPECPEDDTLFGVGVKAGINFNKYFSIEVKTTGDDIPPPITTFAQANLRDLLNENIMKSGYETPTPIQKYAIPILMKGRDLMACAQTGSGKTAAYMIPIIHKLLEKSRDYSDMGSANTVEPRALVFAPTRELAIQISVESKKFSKGSCLKCQVVYGGTSTGFQTRQIFNGCDILVATPGRLLDLVGRGKISFNAIEFVVLDEADRMLDMGFLGDVEKAVQHETMPPTSERQTLMFSATFPDSIQELARRFLNNYIFVTVGIVGAACTDITQQFLEVGKSEKRGKLQEILQEEQVQGNMEGIMVFVDQKRTADFVAAFLSENDYPATSIHGDRLQREREQALNDFKAGHKKILVATSVAARGLDIPKVRHVINYDLPKEIDDYIHRIGRTGRVGNQGKATSFYDGRFDSRLQGDLCRILNDAKQEIPDFLSAGADGGTYESQTFGGQDIRFDDAQSSYKGAAQPVEAEENWE